MLNLSPQEVLDLPVDQLALRVLADLIESREWNEHSYTLKYHQDTQGGFGSSQAAQEAIAEAMGWLRAHGMIARQPNNHSDSAIFVTRWGRAAASRSLAEIQAVDRMQVNLHPLIERKARPQFLLGEYENAIFVAMKAVEVGTV
jgi:hypothetical protein